MATLLDVPNELLEAVAENMDLPGNVAFRLVNKHVCLATLPSFSKRDLRSYALILHPIAMRQLIDFARSPDLAGTHAPRDAVTTLRIFPTFFLYRISPNKNPEGPQEYQAQEQARMARNQAQLQAGTAISAATPHAFTFVQGHPQSTAGYPTILKFRTQSPQFAKLVAKITAPEPFANSRAIFFPFQESVPYSSLLLSHFIATLGRFLLPLLSQGGPRPSLTTIMEAFPNLERLQIVEADIRGTNSGYWLPVERRSGMFSPLLGLVVRPSIQERIWAQE
ncbi:hypothetical protein EJ08DRAFT_375604 [Tothia fuscella]|uniref:Uncharacterized protein n=1 Tax=Tothia fuscella TaxID=1048955 RepID=A0A9P4NLI0_9PEZI|nr:hypothetical protein EJ08DRAFT_375604 [Tothia fuscella]